MPNDSLARSVLYYMERHGSPAEQQQAWRMMAKMYKRHGSLFGEDFAYQMAIDCVDSTSTDFDTLAVAEILSEWCINQSYSTNYDYRQIADSAKTLAKAAGDSVAYYRYMSLGAYVSFAHSLSIVTLCLEPAIAKPWIRTANMQTCFTR